MTYSLAVLSSLLIPYAHSAPLAAAEPCTKEFLTSTANTYINSQRLGNTSSLPSIQASNFIYEENNVVKAIGSSSSLLTTALQIAHNRTIIDTTACATYTEIISTSPSPGHVVATQIRFSDNDGTLRPTLVDSIVTTQGDWLFNATKSLAIVQAEDWSPIPSTRSALLTAIDAYLDLWGNPSAPVPWGVPCRRMEGSAYTGSGLPTDSCNIGIPGGSQPPVTNRRYVVDEEAGSANVLCDFGAMRSGAPDSHEIRLEGGKLRFVHTLTVMRTGG
ncbi:hypothetical protein P154DRAFT_587822 [Amniculicola lignicola CBS 123094]|uniref:DUF8021 domain-containing protein n=1 Tax=Amniculicola lignicola CBS 123094 TaxID=1392246 RepID=A0A6A5WTF0_9PLEO|nr:hypothetical protein P154DRAFT_587822 [Amniculicola lignicola CBS 123094]